MPFKKFFELSGRLNKTNIAPVYYLWGEEHLLQETFLKQIEDILSSSNFEKSTFYGSNLDIDALASSISSLSLFATQRLIVIKEAHKIKGNNEKTIAGMIEQGNLASNIVFINLQKLRKDQLGKNEIIKASAEKGDVVEFRQLYPEECIKFAITELKKGNKTISEKDAEYLYQTSGDNLFDLKNEIDKLVLFTGDRCTITSEDIFKCSGFIRQENVYEITNAILENNKTKALKLIDNLLDSGTETFHLFNLFFWTYRRIIMAKTLQKTNTPAEVILRKVKLWDRNFPDKIKKFSYSEVLKKLECLYNAELSIKSGKIENADFRVIAAELF